MDAGTVLAPQPARNMNALESLAAWKGISALSMAESLLSMDAESRSNLRKSYAAALKAD